MKTIAIIVGILAVAVSAGLWQNSRLKEIQLETARIESRATPSTSSRLDRAGKSDFPPASVSQAEQDEFYEDIVSVMASRTRGKRGNEFVQAERRRKMILISAKFNADDIERFLQRLLQDERLGGEFNELETFQLCMAIFSRTAPEASMEFLGGHRDMAGWKDHYVNVFRSLLNDKPREAIRWFEEQTALGNTDIANSAFRTAILVREARLDPDSMLARAMSPDFASDSEALSHLGGFIATTLGKPAEHRQFLTALRRAQEAGVSSAQLLEIREEYVGNLSETFMEFGFEDTSLIVDSEFTPDEKMRLLDTLSHRGDLPEPAKWAEWMMKIDRAVWKSASDPNARHPAIGILSNWSRSDRDAAGEWLGKIPEGEIRTEMICEYAWNIASIDPLKAADYLPDIPEGKARANIVRKIEKALDSRDPAAANVFSESEGP